MAFDGLKRDARTVENELEQSLEAFSKLCSSSEMPPDEMDEENGLMTEEESRLCQHIETRISKFLGLTDDMSRSAVNPSKAQTASILRNREILHDVQSEVRVVCVCRRRCVPVCLSPP